MKHDMPQQFSYAALFDPAVALAAAERAEHWNLPRHICHPLDRYRGRRASAAVSEFDAAVDLAPVPEEELEEEPLRTASDAGVSADSDFEDEDDL